MSLTVTDIAALASAIKSPARLKDADARALTVRTKDARKRAALEDAQRSAEAFFDYTPAQLLRITALREVHWPRARAVRDALSQCDATLRKHNDTHDDFRLSAYEYDGMVIRGIRLATLLARCYAASAAFGRFPISRADMRTDKRTRFIGSAAARHFTFSGGRDVGSAEFDPADIVQGAFIRALENGDSVQGVPTFGSMFRWIQAERAHLTRVSNAEYAARRNAALGHTTKAVDEWPEMTDKHGVRLLGTRRFPTLAQHRLSLALAHRDSELAQLDDAVAHSARVEALDGAKDEEFHVILTRILMGGATLAEVSDALGLTVETIKRNALESADKSLRIIATGIDHSERSIDMHNAAEREREIDEAEAKHAARLRGIRVAAETVAYAQRHIVSADASDALDADYMERGQRVIVSLEREAQRDGIETVWHSGIAQRQHMTTDGWIDTPDVVRANASWLVDAN